MSVPPSPPAGGSYQPQGYQPYPPAPDGAYQPQAYPAPAAYQPPGGGYPPPPGYQGYGQPPQPPKKGHVGLIAAIVAVVLALGGGGFAAYWFLGRDGDKTPSASETKTSKKATKTKTKTPTPSPTPTKTATPTPTPEPEQAELGVWYECGIGGDLEVWVYGSGVKSAVVTGPAYMWEIDGCGTVTVVEKDYNALVGEAITGAADGTGPDIVFASPYLMRQLVEADAVAELDLSPLDGAVDAKAVASLGGYGVPVSADAVALVRNNEILSETPDTFQEMVEQAKGAGTPEAIAIDITADLDPYYLYPIQASFGATQLETDDDGLYWGDLGGGGEAGREFATYLGTLGSEGVLHVADTAWAMDAFVAGEAPYIIVGSWEFEELLGRGMDLTVLPLMPPAGSSVSSSPTAATGFAIMTTSGQEFGAQEFVFNYATAPLENLAVAQESNYAIPTTLEAQSLLTTNYPLWQGFIKTLENAQITAADSMMYGNYELWVTTVLEIIDGTATDPAATWDAMIATASNGGSTVIDGGYDLDAFCALSYDPAYASMDITQTDAVVGIIDQMLEVAPEEVKGDLETLRSFTLALEGLDPEGSEYNDLFGELIADGTVLEATDNLAAAMEEMCG
ncbi:MAG: extracellular solute-binding protein [Bifidobacteriaceae bacterium]|jgi:arabinogalactan oligomer/maltooligosaccharide transport system substrate-binding protein|nr:extracellular solute-binding protein [Bifidobacteriaceae bacterium]